MRSLDQLTRQPCLIPCPQEAGHGGERAFIFEGNSPGVQAEATYAEALAEVNRLVRDASGGAAGAPGEPQAVPPGCAAAGPPRRGRGMSAAEVLPTPGLIEQPPSANACSLATKASPLHAPQASWLKAQGVRRGDFVCIYMPMILELPYAMVRGRG